MFNSVEYVRNLCQQRRIPVSTLERECGFSNGYLNPKKLTRLPYDRAVVIAEVFGITPEEILTGEKETAPRTPGRSISDEDIKFALFGGDGEITDAMFDEVKQFAAFIKKREAEKKE